jgi:hypothetical protein
MKQIKHGKIYLKKSLVTKTMKPRKEVVSFVKLFKGIKHDRN